MPSESAPPGGLLPASSTSLSSPRPGGPFPAETDPPNRSTDPQPPRANSAPASVGIGAAESETPVAGLGPDVGPDPLPDSIARPAAHSHVEPRCSAPFPEPLLPSPAKEAHPDPPPPILLEDILPPLPASPPLSTSRCLKQPAFSAWFLDHVVILSGG